MFTYSIDNNVQVTYVAYQLNSQEAKSVKLLELSLIIEYKN